MQTCETVVKRWRHPCSTQTTANKNWEPKRKTDENINKKTNENKLLGVVVNNGQIAANKFTQIILINNEEWVVTAPTPALIALHSNARKRFLNEENRCVFSCCFFPHFLGEKMKFFECIFMWWETNMGLAGCMPFISLVFVYSRARANAHTPPIYNWDEWYYCVRHGILQSAWTCSVVLSGVPAAAVEKSRIKMRIERKTLRENDDYIDAYSASTEGGTHGHGCDAKLCLHDNLTCKQFARCNWYGDRKQRTSH